MRTLDHSAVDFADRRSGRDYSSQHRAAPTLGRDPQQLPPASATVRVVGPVALPRNGAGRIDDPGCTAATGQLRAHGYRFVDPGEHLRRLRPESRRALLQPLYEKRRTSKTGAPGRFPVRSAGSHLLFATTPGWRRPRCCPGNCARECRRTDHLGSFNFLLHRIVAYGPYANRRRRFATNAYTSSPGPSPQTLRASPPLPAAKPPNSKPGHPTASPARPISPSKSSASSAPKANKSTSATHEHTHPVGMSQFRGA